MGVKAPWSGGLAAISDSAPQPQYTETINWGDNTTNDTLSVDNSEGSSYIVLAGSHTYVDEGTYTVTVTAADDKGWSATTMGQFNVGAGPIIQIDINETTTTSDDITDINTPIVAKITNKGAAGLINLASSPGITLSPNAVNLGAGAIGTFVITPTAISKTVDDDLITATFNGKKVGQAKMTAANIQVPTHIRNQDTPLGMSDRIPPRVASAGFQIVVTPDLTGSDKFVAHVGYLVADSTSNSARRNPSVARLALKPHSNIAT